jgi:hypothetical protein
LDNHPSPVPLCKAPQGDEFSLFAQLPQCGVGSATAEKLQAITEIDLDELLAIDPPRGSGRD